MALALRSAMLRTLTKFPNPQAATFSTTLPRHPPPTSIPRPAPVDFSPRWLSDLKNRIGYCICFGLSPPQVGKAGMILKEVADGWQELVAGSEGFLTGIERRGLFKHEVVWGEMSPLTNWKPRQFPPNVGLDVHVNNIMYNRYAEAARLKLLHNLAMYIDPAHGQDWRALAIPGGVGLIMGSIQTDYKFPMTWPDRVTVYHKLRPLTADPATINLDVIILSELHQRPAARCVESLVVYDYQLGRKAAMPSFMRDVFEETLRLQDTAKGEYSRRVQNLLKRVRRLERESWDREAAKEDMGSTPT